MKIKCKDCGEEFDFSESEQHFYEENSFAPPKRCKACRQIKKERRLNYGTKKETR